MRGHAINAVLALIFSVLIWGAVGAQLSEEDTFRIDFEMRLPDDVTVSYEGTLSTGRLKVPNVSVTVRGPREEIARLTESEIVGLHDFTRAEEQEALDELLARGRDSVRLRREDISVPPRLEVVAVQPDRVELSFSRVQEQDVEVEAELVGEPAESFAIGSVKIRPSEITVRGPESVLAQYPGPYRTEPIVISGKRDDVELSNRRVNCPPGVTAEQTVSVEITLVPAPVERQITFPISILRTTSGEQQVKPGTFSVEPRDRQGWSWPLTLRGPPEVLDQLEERLRKEIAEPGTQEGLPVAFIRANEFLAPQEDAIDGLDDLVEIGVVGLPDGVSLVSTEKFPIKVRRTE